MTEPLLEVSELDVSVGGQPILTDVQLALGKGEVLGIVGESGSGKTMTSRALTGLLGFIGGTIDRGTLRFGDLDLGALSEPEWRKVRGHRLALVPQSSQSALDPLMTVRSQMVETVAALSGSAGAEGRAKELLESVRLEPTKQLLRAYPHQLSGGMRQRVMIALALAGEAELLIGDEATTALDVTVQSEILDLLGQLRAERGLSIILITHDLDVVARLADKIVVMYAGTTVETGPTQTVLGEPAHPYTAALLGSRPHGVKRGETLAGIAGAPPPPGSWPSGCRFAPRCRHSVDRCRATVPDLHAFGADHLTACLRAEELRER